MGILTPSEANYPGRFRVIWRRLAALYYQLCPFSVVFLCLIALFGIAGAPAFADSREYKIKAVFLYNFTHFVEWPDEPSGTDSSPRHTICVLGDNPFGEALDYIQERQQSSEPFSIYYKVDKNTIKDCTIVFLGQSLGEKVYQLLPFFSHKPVLTVSDAPGFAERGGMIGMIERDNKIRLQINSVLFREAGFKSSKLLELAEILR